MKALLLVSCFFVVTALGCTLYQNEGRKAVENGTVKPISIFAQDEKVTCYSSAKKPDFLSQPLQVIHNAYEARDFDTLLDKGAGWLVVYKLDKITGLNLACEFQFQNQVQLDLQRVPAINRGVELIDNHLGL